MKRRIPELVAPAGSLATFSPGIEAGADAFYFGIGRFNARARAQNIDIEELEAFVHAAHEARKKLYLALNILVRDGEIEEVIRILERVEASGVDAVIVQDLGVLHLIHKYFPSLALHASTQMFLHNSLHIQAMVRRGITRVILPRELRLEEIREIRRKLPVETEVFVHGAMCFSFSGLCLASSYLLGASGNRGVCKQVCRFAFEGDATKYPFSMKDLEGRTHLKALLQLGIEALKIEGRLRNADYVREVVAYYRSCLDEWAAGKPLPEPPSRWRYGRETASGHLISQTYDRMVFANRDPWTGEYVGDVKSVLRGKARIVFHKKVSAGDRLRIVKESGVKVHEFTLLDGSGSRHEVQVADRSMARVCWKVYRLGTSRIPSVRSAGGRVGRLRACPVDLSIRYIDGMLSIEAHLRDRKRYRASFPLESQTGMRPLDTIRIQECFSKVDKRPFRVERILAELDDLLAVPVRELNRVRREFYAGLEDFHDREISKRNEKRRQEILEFFETIGKEEEEPGQGKAAVLEVVPYEKFHRGGAAQTSREILWLELPLFVSETRLESFLKELDELRGETMLGFVCHSLGWVDYLKGRVGEDRIASGGYLYCLNRFAHRLLEEAGVSRILLTTDFPDEDRRMLLRYRRTGVAQEPRLRLFVTRLRLPGTTTYRFKNWSLLAIPRSEYTEVVLRAEAKKDGTQSSRGTCRYSGEDRTVP